jgi:hypothetical protein
MPTHLKRLKPRKPILKVPHLLLSLLRTFERVCTQSQPTSTVIMASINGGSALNNAAMDRSFLTADVPTLLKQMTVEEKISLLAGHSWWK